MSSPINDLIDLVTDLLIQGSLSSCPYCERDISDWRDENLAEKIISAILLRLAEEKTKGR